MYMNFGWPGVAGIMLVLGVLYRWLWNRHMANPQTAVQYAVGLTLGGGMVFSESHLSLLLGGLIQFLVFVWVLGVLLELLGRSE
jgi:hypothetical protein